MNTETEIEVRLMRDLVYGAASTDKNWEYAKTYWMQPSEIAWLKDQLEQRERNKQMIAEGEIKS